MFTLGPTLPYPHLASRLCALLPADLVTILGVDDKLSTLQRLYTSAPGKYALGAQWPLLPSIWRDAVFERAKALVCKEPHEVLQGFRDGEEILANGFKAALALPIVWHTEERVAAGAVNLLFNAPILLTADETQRRVGEAMNLIQGFAATNRLPM